MFNAITDVPGIKVGHHTDKTAMTGCTVVLCESGAVAGVDVRGSAPGTRETDLLRPTNLVEKVQAVILSGGSAFGLDAAGGVMRFLEERERGLAHFLRVRVDRSTYQGTTLQSAVYVHISKPQPDVLTIPVRVGEGGGK